jgi:hypothetical protein
MADAITVTDARQSLEALLGSLGESSAYVTSGSLAPILPGLEVKGVGPIGMPVVAADAKRILTKASQAPYGRGAETIVDTGVRRVWQIEPSQIALRNPAWNTQLATIVETVKQELGIRQKVNAELYKLLVYEKGSFFAPHRDTEKIPGMFATLVICLPTRHQGGTLIVRHEGQTTKIDFGGQDAEFKTQYAAFYADCQHEITPVVAGYRVCLVYNLAIARKKQQPGAPQHASAIDRLARLLKAVLTDEPNAPRKIAIPFEHQYTEAGLDPKQLKGSDRARADVLSRAAKSLDYQCYVALLTVEQSGAVDYDTWDGGYSRRPSYDWSFDEDDDDEFNDDYGESDDLDADMGEVYDEEWSLDHWLDVDGRKQPFGRVHLGEVEILNREDRDSWSVRQEVHEATGNEGVSMDRWYRQGVIVIWPSDRTFEILAGEGPASALPELERRMARSKKRDALADCRTFANEIVANWKREEVPKHGEPSYPQRMLKLIERLGDAQLAERFLCDVFPDDYDGSEGKDLVKVCGRFGWDTVAPWLQNFLARQEPEDYSTSVAQVVSICETLCCDPPELTKERRAVCRSLAEPLERLIEQCDKRPVNDWRIDEGQRTGVVASVIRIFTAVNATEHLSRFISHVLKERDRYDLHKVLIPDTKVLQSSVRERPAAARLLEHCLHELRAATAKPIEPPQDWARDADLACSCEDCRALSQFLRDPVARVGRFPLRKDRRQHLHRQIDHHGCDCTHLTERKGSPQTLVCTKTQSSYERRLKQYDVDKKLLAELELLAGAKEGKAVKKRAKGRTSKR